MRPLLGLLALWAAGPPAGSAARPSAQAARRHYDAEEAARLVPLLLEVLRFPTLAGNASAQAAQKAWLLATGRALGFSVHDAGPVTEIELAGPAGAPVLGLIVHGDVTAVDESAWAEPPFAAHVKDGRVVGRGAADDKGPLVQALLAMKALAAAGPARTHTVRLLVGSDEESGATDMREYRKAHQPPALSLVLDSAFPVVVGEKAWNTLTVTTAPAERPATRAPPAWAAVDLRAGLSPSIVPDRATLSLRWRDGAPRWEPLVARLRARKPEAGTTISVEPRGDTLVVAVKGRAAHAGVNLEGGRNALVALARLTLGELAPGGIADLLAFAREAGRDLYGSGLGLGAHDPLWGRYAVNVATVAAAPGAPGRLTLTINLRRPPPMTGADLERHLRAVVQAFDARTGAALEPGGFYADEPLAFDPRARIVRRLLAAYERATGKAEPPAISGGGTYAKRLPAAIAFGMWFPGRAYPGHDVDEAVPIADLHRGVHVLLEALADLACAPPLEKPFQP